jgi:hypothetical protein
MENINEGTISLIMWFSAMFFALSFIAASTKALR